MNGWRRRAGPRSQRIEEIGRVGQQVERRAGGMQALDQRHHLGEDDVVHFVEALVEGGDQRLLAGMQGLQATCRLGRIAAVILHHVPLPRGHLGQEPLHLGRVGDELAVEVARVPVDQHAAEVEDHDGGSGRGTFRGQNQAFSQSGFRDQFI